MDGEGEGRRGGDGLTYLSGLNPNNIELDGTNPTELLTGRGGCQTCDIRTDEWEKSRGNLHTLIRSVGTYAHSQTQASGFPRYAAKLIK